MPNAPRGPRHGALDLSLGERIRERRRGLRLSQSALGARLGITFQQVQKYENGTNRVSAVMLVRLATALDVSVSELLSAAEPPATGPGDNRAEADRLLAAFGQITSPELRQAVLTLVTSLAGR